MLKIAQAAGLDSFDKVEALSYTFYAQLGERSLRREWTWLPQTDDVGYTPGDVYDLFYDENYRVTHWVFRKGGSETPTQASEWIDYEDFNGIDLSLNRPSSDESFRIWFEDASVKSL